MASGVPLSARLRAAVMTVLLMPVLLSSLIAPGIMPRQAPDGAFVMVICPDAGAVELAIDLATGAPVESPAEPRDDRCAWAAARLAATVPAAAVAPMLAVLAETRLVPVHADALWRPAFDPAARHARRSPGLV